jgi:hypothetical protein
MSSSRVLLEKPIISQLFSVFYGICHLTAENTRSEESALRRIYLVHRLIFYSSKHMYFELDSLPNFPIVILYAFHAKQGAVKIKSKATPLR